MDAVREKALNIIIVITYSYLSILTIVVGVLMILALRTFVKVVKSSPIKKNLNNCFIFVQILCLILLGLVWLSQGIFILHGVRNDFDNFKATYIMVICDMIGFFASMSFFMIMA